MSTKEWWIGTAGRGEGQRIRAQTAVYAAKRRYLKTQPARIDEDQPHQAGLRHHMRILAHSTDVARITQRDTGYAVLLCLLYEELRGKDRAHLTEPIVGVHDRSTGMFAHDFRYRLRINNLLLPHGAPILFHAHHAMGIMAVEIGLHQVIGDNPGVIGTTAQSGKKFVANAAQGISGNGRHRWLLSAFHKSYLSRDFGMVTRKRDGIPFRSAVSR